ncbi:hypothetical protein ACFL5F_04045 [Planctomycetota bacterium]
MNDKDKSNNQTIAVQVYNTLEQDFLFELALEQGFRAWTEPDSHTRVYLTASRGEVEGLLKKAGPAFRIIASRRRQLLAEAMLFAGSKESVWPKVISETQAEISLFIRRNEHLDPVLKTVEKARVEVSPRRQFASEVLESLDHGYEEFVQSRQ